MPAGRAQPAAACCRRTYRLSRRCGGGGLASALSSEQHGRRPHLQLGEQGLEVQGGTRCCCCRCPRAGLPALGRAGRGRRQRACCCPGHGLCCRHLIPRGLPDGQLEAKAMCHLPYRMASCQETTEQVVCAACNLMMFWANAVASGWLQTRCATFWRVSHTSSSVASAMHVRAHALWMRVHACQAPQQAGQVWNVQHCLHLQTVPCVVFYNGTTIPLTHAGRKACAHGGIGSFRKQLY